MPYLKKVAPLFLLYIFIRGFSFIFPPESIVNTCFSLVPFIATVYLLIKKDERGWYIVATELCLGGTGNFLSISFLSLRTCLAIVALSIFFVTHFKSTIQTIKNNKYLIIILSILYLTILNGAIQGYLHHHSIQLIIADSIPYLFFLYYFPLTQLLSSESFKSFGKLLIVTTFLGNTVFTLFTFFGYAFNLFTLHDSYYHWFRDIANGKITDLGLHFFRIVLNEQLLLIPLLLLWVYQLIHYKEKATYPRIALISLYVSSLIILALNITRIYLVGLSLGLVLLFSKRKIQQWLFYSIGTLGIFFILFTSFHLIASRGQSLGWEVFGLRIQSIAHPTTEESSLSRILLLKPISEEIKKHPIGGNGLGDTITVYSPVEKRTITTSQFDWGYLEILAELGIVGLIAWGILLLYLLKNLWGVPYQAPLASLASLSTINLTSPALFHVLGILLMTIFISLPKTKLIHASV